jgi:hypothetical protein
MKIGTRSVCGIRIDQADKLSYNQFDGYPSGVGAEILAELQERFKNRVYEDVIGELKQKARTARLIAQDSTPSDGDIRKMQQLGAVDLSVSKQSTKDWYCLCRKHQGSILQRLDAGVFLDGNFGIEPKSWCEYGYILNLDDETLEFYDIVEKPEGNASRYGSELVHVYSIKDFIDLPDTSDLDKRLEKEGAA